MTDWILNSDLLSKSDRNSILLYAAESGKADLLKKLVAKGVDLDSYPGAYAIRDAAAAVLETGEHEALDYIKASLPYLPSETIKHVVWSEERQRLEMLKLIVTSFDKKVSDQSLKDGLEEAKEYLKKTQKTLRYQPLIDYLESVLAQRRAANP